jgi:hypothetical protein
MDELDSSLSRAEEDEEQITAASEKIAVRSIL